MTSVEPPNAGANRPVRALYVDNSYTFGGAIIALQHLASGLDRSKVQPVFLLAQDAAYIAEHFPDEICYRWDVRLPWAHDRFHRRFMDSAVAVSAVTRAIWNKGRALWWLLRHELPTAVLIAWIAKRHDIDVIHLNNGLDGMLAGLLAGKIVRRRVIAHARGPQRIRGLARMFSSWLDHYIAVSSSIRQNLLEGGVPPHRIAVIHDAIDLSTFIPENPPATLGAELGIPKDAPVFGFFGRIVAWKGIKEFIAAAELVLRDVEHAHAIIVGDPSDGEAAYFQEVQQMAQRAAPDGRIKFLGFRPDVPALMRLCDVVVHTSIVPEPFGMVLIEAMAAARPVIAANAGGPLEIVEHDRTGVLVDPRDSVALSGAIAKLLTDTDMAAEMGRRGAERVRDHFSASRYAADVTALYASVLSACRRPLLNI